MNRLVDTYYTFRFIRLLTQPWEESAAYSAGIIDSSGKQLIKPADFTITQKSIYTRFVALVYNIKRLIEKVPLGKTSIAKYVSAGLLLKEWCDPVVLVEFLAENNEKTEDLNLLLENFTSGIDVGGHQSFAGSRVFDVDSAVFHKCRFGKKHKARYKTYVGSEESGKSIADYCLKNPRQSVILKNTSNGSMIYFRYKTNNKK